MASGRADAVVIYANNEPLQLEALGIKVNILRVSDYVELASNGLITNERTIAERPELVEKMVMATLRGIRDTINDPDSAYEVSKKYVEGLAETDQAVQQKVLAESIDMWRADRLGAISPEAWQNMQQVLLKMGLLDEATQVEVAYTNEFIP